MFKWILSAILIVIMLAGCSSAGNPVTSEADIHNDYLSPIIDLSETGDTLSTIGLLGGWEFVINPDDMSAELIAKRSSAIGEAWIVSGISYFTISPCPDCLKMTGLELLDSGIIKVHFTIKHPFEPHSPPSPIWVPYRYDLDVFDVVLIVHPKDTASETFAMTARSVYAGLCFDPDGYTTELVALIGDQVALPYFLVIDDSITGSSTFNEFEMGTDAEFDIGFDLTSGTIVFDLYLTMGYGWSATKAQRLNPKYYNPEFNRKAAWKVEVIPPEPAEEGFTWDDEDPNTTYDVLVHVYDWQQGSTVYDNPEDFHNAPSDNIYAPSDVMSVSVEIPGMTSTLPTEISAVSGSGAPDDPLVYQFPIANENLILAGEYTGLVRVLDERATSQNYLTEHRDYLIHSPDGVTLNEYLMTEYATYQTFTASVLEKSITDPTGDLVWVKRASGSQNEHGYSVTTLPNNTIAVTGVFRDSTAFAPGESNETVLTAVGGNDIFIAWYNPDGTLISAKNDGGASNDSGHGIASFPDNSVVVTGNFSSTATFGRNDPNETQLSSQGDTDIFVAKYNADRTLAWVKSAVGTSRNEAEDVTILSDNSVVVTGNFQGTVIFASGEPNQTNLESVGDRDIFVACFNPDGSLQWAKRAGGSTWDYGRNVTTLSDDSIVVCGQFGGSSTFGPGEPNQITLHAAGTSHDVFVARYNKNGFLQWAKRAGGTSYDYSLGVAGLSDDSVAITGGFNLEAVFGEGEVNQTTLISPGYGDIFLARYNPDGTLNWAKRAGGSDDNAGFGITSLPDDSLVITGHFIGTAVFGHGEPNEVILGFDGEHDIFVARYNPDGSVIWAKKAFGPGRNVGRSVARLSDNSPIVVGSFSLACTFGSDEVNETTLNAVVDSADVFIARFEP